MKKEHVKDTADFNKYVKNTVRDTIVITWIVILVSFLMLLITFKIGKIYFFTTSILFGLAGTAIIGLSTSYSTENILKLSSMHLDYDIDKADDLIRTRLWTSIGTVLLLSSIICQTISTVLN